MAKAKKKTPKKSKSTRKSKKAKPAKAAKSAKSAKSKVASKSKASRKAAPKAAKKVTKKVTQNASKKKVARKTATKVTGKAARKTASAPKTKTPVKKTTTAQPAVTKLVDISQFVTPLDDRIVVQLSLRERVTSGGLIIPDTVDSTEGYREGIILAAGRGHRDQKGRLRPMDVKNGDKILFLEHAGAKLRYQNVELLILRETDVMGVVS